MPDEWTAERISKAQAICKAATPEPCVQTFLNGKECHILCTTTVISGPTTTRCYPNSDFADYARDALPSALQGLLDRNAEIERLQDKADNAHTQWTKADKEMNERGHEIGRLQRGPEWLAFEAELQKRTAECAGNINEAWQIDLAVARTARDKADAEVERLCGVAGALRIDLEARDAEIKRLRGLRGMIEDHVLGVIDPA